MEDKIIEMLQTLIDMSIEDRADIKELKADVAELKTDVAELKTDVAELKTDVAELKTDVAELKTDVAELKTDVKTLKSQRMIDTNNLALVLNQQTKMLKMLEDIYGNNTNVNYIM